MANAGHSNTDKKNIVLDQQSSFEGDEHKTVNKLCDSKWKRGGFRIYIII